MEAVMGSYQLCKKNRMGIWCKVKTNTGATGKTIGDNQAVQKKIPAKSLRPGLKWSRYSTPLQLCGKTGRITIGR
jgi:hypothetical protein